jgi:hypothetical protein
MTGPAARAAALLFALCCITPVLAHPKAPPPEAVAVAGNLGETSFPNSGAAAAYRRTLTVHPNRRLAVAGLNAALGAEAAKGGPDAAKGQMTRSERPVDPRP